MEGKNYLEKKLITSHCEELNDEAILRSPRFARDDIKTKKS